MTSNDDLDVLARAAARLQVRSRAALPRWTHLSLCVLDAVFSINAHYTGVTRVCARYADYANLRDPILPGTEMHRVVGTGLEQPVEELAKAGRELGPERFAHEVLDNRGRTSTRSGILKAEAAILYAEALAAEGIHKLADVAAVSDDHVRSAVEGRLRAVPGDGVRLTYLWMTTGQNHLVKPDRMVLAWLAAQLGRRIDVATARTLLSALAERLECTPWELDHAVWRAQSGRERDA